MMTKSNQPQSDLPPKLAAPAERALAGAGFTKLEQFTEVTEAEVKKLHGVGPNAINKLKVALEAKGWSFKAE